MPFYERQPYIQPLHQIVTEVMRGEILVPRFQQLTWRPDQRGALLDSLYRGFPVGTILLWSTASPIPTLDVVGGFQIPRPSVEGGIRRLVLDGHQRLSTLVQLLGPGLITSLSRGGTNITRAPLKDADSPELSERWVFELNVDESTDNSRDRFVLLKPDQQPTPTQLPLDIVLNLAWLNRWIRDRETPLTDQQGAAADSLRDRLREYSLPVAVLTADSLKEATEIFKRINSSGTQMGEFQMVAALAFTATSDLQRQFAEARAEHLEAIGWAGITDSDVLRVCAGLENADPVRLDVEGLAAKLRNDQELVKRAFEAVVHATKVLRECGVFGPEALPYAWQMITLAVYLGRQSRPPASLDEAATRAAVEWFWITTYGEVFAGGNSAIFDRSIQALEDMIGGRSWNRMERDVSRQVRPVDGFDFRTARSKACALSMARRQDKGRLDGPAHKALAEGVSSMQLLFARGRRSRWWHLAIVTPEPGLPLLRDALRRRERGTPELGDVEILDQLGVESGDAGSLEDLLGARCERLMAAEKDFISALGLTWASRSE